MQSKEHNNIILVRLFTDEKINDKILEVCKQYNIKNAVILSGIGQVKKIRLGYFKEKGNYLEEEFQTPLEILSLTGNIIKNKEEYILHLHTVLGTEDKKTLGGHLIDATVGVTAEIFILKTDIKAHRRFDEKTGLKSLFLE